MAQDALFPEGPVVERGKSAPLQEAPDHRSRVLGQQIGFDTVANILADHRMPDTARPLVHSEGSHLPLRLANDSETIADIDNEHYLEHDPDRPVSDLRWQMPTIHVRTADGGYRSQRREESERGMPGDARPEITEHDQSHVKIAQLATRAPDATVLLESHAEDPEPTPLRHSADPVLVVANDRRAVTHRQKDAHRRAGDLRQRQGEVPGPWEEGEVAPLQVSVNGVAQAAYHSSSQPSLHLTRQLESPNPAQQQGMSDVVDAMNTRERLRHFSNELRATRR